MHFTQLKCSKKQDDKVQKISSQKNQNDQNPRDYEPQDESSNKMSYDKLQEILNQSQKRLIENIKKLPIRKGSLFESKKMKRLQLNFHSISDSKDSKKNISDHIKMPDLLKIKLKKQLQIVQKTNQNSFSSNKQKFSENFQSKIKKPTNILFNSNENQSAQHQKRYQIVKANIKNPKNSQSTKQKKKLNYLQKCQEKQQNVNLNEKRKLTKYFHLLHFAQNKEIQLKFQQTRKINSMNRVKTQILTNSRLFSRGDCLQLEGTQIFQDNLLSDHRNKLTNLFEQNLIERQIRDAYMSRKRRDEIEKNTKAKSRSVKSENKKLLPIKNQQISPWFNNINQTEMINNNLVFSDDCL